MKPREKPLGNDNLIGARVTRLRQARHWKQTELLARLNERGIPINASGLSRLEGQIRLVTDKELQALAEIFAISIDELVNGPKA
jgi:transcriptional regulator with XRE-family HTH domain